MAHVNTATFRLPTQFDAAAKLKVPATLIFERERKERCKMCVGIGIRKFGGEVRTDGVVGDGSES